MKIISATANLAANDGQDIGVGIIATKVLSVVQIQIYPVTTPMDADIIACAVKVARLIDPNYMK